MTATYDGIIIGAGPAGSSAAILLARAGWSVALLEAKAFPRRKVCGECIAASNLPLLEVLGVGAEIRRRAGPELRRVALWRGGERISAPLPAHTDRHPWGYALGRESLDALLLARARSSGAGRRAHPTERRTCSLSRPTSSTPGSRRGFWPYWLSPAAMAAWS